jgi:hypothetical protein
MALNPNAAGGMTLDPTALSQLATSLSQAQTAAGSAVTGGYATPAQTFQNLIAQYGVNSAQAQTYYQQNQAALDPNGENNQSVPELNVDPQLGELGQEETALATSFQNNIPSMAATFADQVAQVNKANLAASIENNTASYNSRGLLYSTGLQGANSASQESAAETQASEVASENQNLQTTSNSLNSAALGTQEAIAGEENTIGASAAALNAQYLNTALQNQNTQNAAIAGAASGVGSAAGYGLGLLGTASPTASSTSGMQGGVLGQGGYANPSLGVNTNLGYGGPYIQAGGGTGG